MKRSILIFLVLLLAISFASASDNAIGVSFMPHRTWYSVPGAEESFLGVLAAGSNYFGENRGGFGIEYGAGLGISTGETDTEAALVGNVGFGYKHPLKEKMGLVAGIGILGILSEPQGTDLLILTLDLYARLGITYDVSDSFGVNAGVLSGGNLLTSRIEDGGSLNYSFNSYFVALYAGASFLY